MDNEIINLFGINGHRIIFILTFTPFLIIIWTLAIKLAIEIFKKGEIL